MANAAPTAIQSPDHARSMVSLGFRDAHHCMGILAILERSQQGGIPEHVEAAGAGRTARILLDAALVTVVMKTTRCFSPIWKDDLHMRPVFSFIAQHDDEFADSGRELRAASQASFARCETDPRLERLTVWRNKEVAHVGVMPPHLHPLVNDLLGFAPLVAETWTMMAHGLELHSLSLDGQVDAYRDSADEFWKVWER